MKDMQNFIKKIKNDNIIKKFSILFSGAALTQIITLILSPVLTRLYTPEHFGVNAIYISTLTIFGIIATVRLNVAIAITDSKAEKKILSWACFIFSVVFSILTLLIIVLFEKQMTSFLNINQSEWVWIIPVSTLLAGVYEILFQNLLSNNQYKKIVNISILKVSTQGILQILFYFFDLGYMGLIFGNLFSYLVTIVAMIYILRVDYFLISFSKYRFKKVINKYKKFPKFAFPAELINITAYSIIPFIVTYMFAAETTGYYALANKLIGIPIGLFGDSLRKVYLREASQEFNDSGTVSKSFIKTSKILMILVIPLAFCLWIFSPIFFKIFFGEEWVISGYYVRCLLLFFSARLVVLPLMSTVNIIGKQKIGLIGNSILLVSILSLTYLFNLGEGLQPEKFFFLLSVVTSVVYFSLYYIVYLMAKKIWN